MIWAASRGIGWKAAISWAVAVLVGSPLCAQPMPWPSDLGEHPPAVGSSEEPPSPPTPSEIPSPKAPSSAGAELPSAKQIQELKPSLYYLKDKQGNLQPVPGFTLEEFRELYELKHLLEQKSQPPGYSLQAVEIQGEVQGARAELTIEVRVLVRSVPVRIPLRLEGVVIRKFEGMEDSPDAAGSSSSAAGSQKSQPAPGPAKPGAGEVKPSSSEAKPPSPEAKPVSSLPKASSGQAKPDSLDPQAASPPQPKEAYLLDWEEGEGYVVWILSGPDSSHRLRLQGAVPVQQVGQQNRLRLRCLRAPVSQMQLRIPGQGWKVEASDPAVLLQLEAVSERQSQLKLEGFGGNVELVWWSAGDLSLEPSSTFEVTGETIARLEGQKITTQVNLFVKVFGHPCQELPLRLPEGAKLRPINQPGCTYSMEKPDRITLHFLDKATEHRLRLEWEQALGTRAAEDWVEVGGLEVIGAIKHRGYIAVWGPGQAHLLWRASASVRQTEQVPASLLGEGFLAGFEYTSQPYWLQLRLIHPQVRVSVEPEYRLWVSARDVKLEALLKCTVRGAKVHGLRVEMPGWELEEIGPEELVGDWPSPGEGPVVEISLKQPTGGHLELTLVARRAIPGGTKQLAVPLPQGWQVQWPPGGMVSLLPASVVVIPEENVELTPEEKQMSGWVRQVAANLSGLPKRQQPILAYRADSGAGSFLAGLRVHERQVRVEGTAQLLVEPEGVQVEEKLSYTIAYEMVGTLTLWAPPAIPPEALQVLVDTQPVSPVPISPSAKGPEEVGSAQLAIPLPQPRIGPCDLSIRYRLKWEKLPTNQSQLRDVPLVVPTEGQWLGWRVTITGQEGLEVKVRSANWKPLESLPEPAGKENRLLVGCSEPLAELPLGVYRKSLDQAGPLQISRAFVQTWWTRSGREDRAVYRLRGRNREFTVRLPEGANTEEVAVWVNGRPARFQLEAEGRLLVPLPPESPEWVVELRYHFREFRPPRGWLEVAFPEPEPSVWMDQCYWLCHLPRDEHLIINPTGLVPEYRWGWNGWSWARVPRWTHADLEAWIGASPAGLVPEGLNTYLFSTIGALHPTSLYTTGRSVLVLTASLAALGLGLLVIYVPAFRHPVWAVAAGVGLGALALLWPEQTVLGVQAAGLGVILAVVAAWLQGKMAARQRATARIPGASLEQESTQRQYLPPPPGSTGSTQLMPSVPASNVSADLSS